MIRVLIVDDQLAFRKHAVRLLQSAGMDVVAEADNIAEAEVQVRLHRPDLALVDLMLPEMNGIEGTARLKALHPSLRVILVSAMGNHFDALRAAALEAGAEDFVPKDALCSDRVRTWQQPEWRSPGADTG